MVGCTVIGNSNALDRSATTLQILGIGASAWIVCAVCYILKNWYNLKATERVIFSKRCFWVFLGQFTILSLSLNSDIKVQITA